MSSNETPNAEAVRKEYSIKVIGVGGAGGNLVSRMAGDNPQNILLAALNTDAQALTACAAKEKLLLGAKLTRGLGAGGDPDVAQAAAKEDFNQIKSLCAGTEVVLILAGLGGGTGTGASPIVANAAKEAGALVLAIVALPFEFEGSRRQRQAQLGLRDLKSAADAVICLPNEKVFKLIDENTSVLDTFKTANDLMIQGARGIWRMATQSGLVNVDFADLCAVTRDRHSESSFAAVETSGANRSSELVTKLFEHPLLDAKTLGDSESRFVSRVGGAELTRVEVRQVKERLNKECKGAHLVFGAAVDETFSGKMAILVVASRRVVSEEPVAETSRIPRELESSLQSDSTSRGSSSRFTPPAPNLTQEKKEQIITRQMRGSRRKKADGRQGQLPLEILSRGRFEKSEPTIYQGEDLDVPTFIRRRISLN